MNNSKITVFILAKAKHQTPYSLFNIINKLKEKGLTIVPTLLFINEKGWAKITIAIAKGKKFYDKRDSIKKKDIARDLERSM